MVCWGGCGESSLCEERGEVVKRGFVVSLCVSGCVARGGCPVYGS